MRKHWTNYLPEWLTLNPVTCILSVWREREFALRDCINMWREAERSDRIGSADFLGIERTVSSEFFRIVTSREHEEGTEWRCVYGCCVIYRSRSGRDLGSFGPADCPCDELDDPRDVASGPIRG